MSYRINVIIEDQVWESLKTVPRGERSKLINQAIAERLLMKRRVEVAKEMDELRSKLPTLDSQEILNLIRSDRKRTK